MDSSAIANTLMNHKIFVVAFLIFILLCIMYMREASPKKHAVLVHDLGQTNDWQGQDPSNSWTKQELISLPVSLKDITYNSALLQDDGYINVFGDYYIYHREVRPDKSRQFMGNALFLHGANYTSKRWMEMGTLHLAAKMGFRAVAVDLPGHGNSRPLSFPSTTDAAKFMATLCTVLRLKKPVLVSPSISSIYSLPVIIQEPKILSGFASISGRDGGHYDATQLHNNQIPTLLIYDGSKYETTHSVSSLRTLPNSRAFYLGHGDLSSKYRRSAFHDGIFVHKQEFHWLLYNFLRYISDLTKHP